MISDDLRVIDSFDQEIIDAFKYVRSFAIKVMRAKMKLEEVELILNQLVQAFRYEKLETYTP
jgi:hypothetical protein